MADNDRAIEDPCPSCGVLVRRGLVRCWNCGSFMRPEIAAAYERMQNRRPDVDFRPLPEHSARGRTSSRSAEAAPSELADFELTGAFGSTLDRGREAEKPSGSPSGGTRATGRRPLRPAGSEVGPNTQPVAEAATSVAADAASKPMVAEASPSPAAPVESEKPAAEKPTTEKPKKSRPATDAATTESHSVATGGDALLQVALQEEMESARRGGRGAQAFNPVRVADGWMITCPCPARIRIKVKEQHRGKTGKCPNPQCGGSFAVPADLPMPESDEAATEAAATVEAGPPADPADKAGPYTHWLRDVRLHAVKPAKARRKPGGHEKDFQPADLAFSKTAGLLAVSLTVKPAGLMAKKKKPEEVRTEVAAGLVAGKPAAELPCETRLAYEPATLGKLVVESPPAYEHESTFAGVPVFGEGRIAVKLSQGPQPDELHFVSLTLSQYRRLKNLLAGLFDQPGLGLGCPIPEADETATVECHYSETSLAILRQPAFYLSDPELPLDTVGYRCESCGLIVGEESRRKEKIGGLDGKKLAGAKCPKCKGKFGESRLYALAAKPETPPPAAEAATGTPAT